MAWPSSTASSRVWFVFFFMALGPPEGQTHHPALGPGRRRGPSAVFPWTTHEPGCHHACGSCLCPTCRKGRNPRSLGALALNIRKKVTKPVTLSPEEGAGRRETFWLMYSGPAGWGDGGGVLGTHKPPTPCVPSLSLPRTAVNTIPLSQLLLLLGARVPLAFWILPFLQE